MKETTVNAASTTDTVTLHKKCPFCGAITHVIVDSASLAQYNAGAYVQVAFANLSADKRELIKTGICLPCQKEVFGE